MTKPIVSVIIPAYKAENLILDALMSVKAQIYTAWEVIVVEDASQDRTEEIVHEFARDVGDRRVKYIRHQNNQGVSVTRNTAIQHALGEYLAFLDHDDLWKETHLEAAVSKLEETGGDLAYSTVQMFEDGTHKNLGFWGPEQQDLENFPASIFARNYIQPSAVVMKRKIPEAIGFFDANLRGVQDLDYWLRGAASGLNFVYVSGIHSFYRKRTPSALTSNIKMILEEHAIVLRKYRKLNIIPITLRKHVAVQYQLKAAKINLISNPMKATYLFLWAWNISPKDTILELRTVILKRLLPDYLKNTYAPAELEEDK